MLLTLALLLDGPVRCLKTCLRMCAIAERFGRRAPTAAERHGLSVGVELVAFGVGNSPGTPHQVRAVIQRRMFFVEPKH